MFKIGDKVRVTEDFYSAISGDEGIIKALPGNNGVWGAFFNCYSVEFPDWDEGHDCNGTVQSGHGQWVAPEYLELIKSAHSEKIVITHDGKNTLARLYENNKVVKSAEAKCDPRDEFNFAVGAKLAFERLMGEEKEKEEPPKFDKAMLTNGRFGYMENEGWFVVVGDHLVYESGSYDWFERMTADGKYRGGYGVKYIVEGKSFRMAKSERAEVIWCAPDFDPKKVTK